MQNPSTFQVYNASAGSGKTFTLVKEYLKILLQTSNSNYFRHILAVTFTNKAAAEMKERVINNLREFTSPTILQNKTDMFKRLEEELSITDTKLHQRAEKILQSILQNYSAFNITTIDSFTYRLIRNFSFDLGLSLNFDVEMDSKSLLNEAVESLVAQLGEDKDLTKVLLEFSLQKTNDDKAWDITHELNDMAQMLLNENDNSHIQQIQEKPLQDFIDLKKDLQKKQADIKHQFIEIGQKGLELIDSNHINYKSFSYGGEFPNHFKKLEKGLFSDLKYDGRLNKNIEEDHHFQAAKAAANEKLAIESILEQLKNLYFQSKIVYENSFETYTLNKLFLSSLIPLAVLSRINKALDELKEDKNIRLNAEFNRLISANLQEQPASYIYERIGEKLKHYFIDEMQDTSLLQWQNIVPLINNALSQENTSLLLVGDTKQAIYRWRGSEPEQFMQLAKEGKSTANNPFFIPKQTQTLGVNYRSYTEVIHFNNQFFQHISSFFNKAEYAEIYRKENQQKPTTKTGGFVQLSFIEKGLVADDKKTAYSEKVLDIITKVKANFALNEICVLTRKRKEGVAIANFLTENGIAIISSETLLIQNSEKVQFIIHLLYYLQHHEDQDAKLEVLYFLHNYLQIHTDKHSFFKEALPLPVDEFFTYLKSDSNTFNVHFFSKLSLYESIEYIIRSFYFNTISDAYIQFFLDEILQFSQKKLATIAAFLEFWETKKEVLSIVVPEEKNAVRIMTIHKSKGLEFPVVIYPFDLNIYGEQNPKVWYPIVQKEKYHNFDSLLITNPKSLSALEKTGELGKRLYQNHKNELELDNFNLIYVALTRAIEQLYIVGEMKKITADLKTSSQFFIHYLEATGQYNEHLYDYSFGNFERVSTKPKVLKNQYIFNEITSTSWSSHNINIVTNLSSLHDDEIQKSINYGNLIHEILANIKTADDIEETIRNYTTKGIITKIQADKIQQLIMAVVKHPELTEYFQQNNTVYNEREIFTAQGEVSILDRLVINTKNEAVIIDYKTGKPDKKYQQQLNHYARVVSQLEYKVIRKLLVYIGENITVEDV